VEREDLSELHYLAPIANVPSILERGILSHQRARSIRHETVAMQEVQERRSRVAVPNGRPLHHYVNLYVHARNPMLYKRQSLRDSLCVLQVDTSVLDLPGVVVADQNASSSYVRFAAGPNGLRIIDKQLAFAESWTHQSPIEYYRRKSARCAEILVPEYVRADLIHGAYVPSEHAQRELSRVAPSISAVVDSHLFFL